jgi:hypothetical protein
MLDRPKKLYTCNYCGTDYDTQIKVDKCKKKHEIIYVPISRGDLNRLINFIYIRDESLLTRTLMDTLTSYLKGNTSEK